MKQEMGSDAEMVTFAIPLPYPSPCTPVMKQVSISAFMVIAAQCEVTEHFSMGPIESRHDTTSHHQTHLHKSDVQITRSCTCENHSSVRIVIRTSASKATVSSGLMDSGGSPPEQHETYQSRRANHKSFPDNRIGVRLQLSV